MKHERCTSMSLPEARRRKPRATTSLTTATTKTPPTMSRGVSGLHVIAALFAAAVAQGCSGDPPPESRARSATQAQAGDLLGFLATSADACAFGSVRVSGFQVDELNWSLHGLSFNLSPPGSYLEWTWSVSDALGVLGSGSYSSRNPSVNTGSTGPSGAEFTAPRAPVGSLAEMSFTASGSVYGLGTEGPCGESFYITTATTATSGGSWFYNTGTGLPPIPISVVSATYGGNVGAVAGNATAALASACNDHVSCTYAVWYTVLGDPAPGEAKDFVAQWRCGSGPLNSTSTPAEAGFGSQITLACP